MYVVGELYQFGFFQSDLLQSNAALAAESVSNMGYNNCFEHSHKALEISTWSNLSFSRSSSDSPCLLPGLHFVFFSLL